jgi:hypothetical protein
MRISPTCWYNAQAGYPRDADKRPFIILQGGGDDFGVFITADADSEGATADLHLESGEIAGRDARAVVHALQAIPNWSSFASIERAISGLS